MSYEIISELGTSCGKVVQNAQRGPLLSGIPS